MSDLTPPEKIYLQTGAEEGDPEWLVEVGHGEITWCAEKIHDSDIEYARADLLTAERARADAATVKYGMMNAACEAANKRLAEAEGKVERLRASLAAIQLALQNANGSSITDTIWMHDSPAETLFDFISAALADGGGE